MDTQAKIDLWKSADLPADLSLQLNSLSKEQLEDAFYQEIVFGTAGMRGTMGVGSNRINLITVAQTTKALANHMLADGVDQSGVVISFDSRNNSNLFAATAAQVLSAANIPVYLFDGPHPTPELSFAVRYLKTYAGIMITASHNPKADNGYKLYGADGGQLPPQAAEKIILERQKLLTTFEIEKTTDNIKMIGEDIDQEYLKNVKEVSINLDSIRKNGDQLQMAFTPLHGAGGNLAVNALEQAGFKNVTIIDQQFAPDGDFPTVEKPNPEDANVFKLAEETKLPVLIAIDPDGDRMGIAVKQDNQYQVLTGNQIAVLMIDYLSQRQTNLTNPMLVTSNVSSLMPSVIGKTRGIGSKVVLTGFKWIADSIVNFENNDSQFIFGFEESYGYLIKPFVRDKDAIQATLLMSEIVLNYQLENKTIIDRLGELYQEFGYFKEVTLAIDFAGETGQKQMETIIEKLRDNPIDSIADFQVVEYIDYSKEKPAANVLRYQLADDCWFAIRPSGTEPKLKVYLGIKGTSDQDAKQKMDRLSAAVEEIIKD